MTTPATDTASARANDLGAARPKALPGTEIVSRRAAGKPWAIRTPDGLGFSEADDQELALWRLLDGTRTVEDLLLSGMTWAPPVSLDWIGATLAGFARGRLLEGEWKTAQATSRVRIRFGGPISATGWERTLRRLGQFAFAFLPLLSLLPIAATILVEGLSMMPPGATPWALPLAFCLPLCVAELARALGYLSASRPLEQIGIGFVWQLPVPCAQPPPMSPAEGRRSAIWAIGSQVLVCGFAALGVLGFDSPFCGQLLALGLAVLILNSSPLFESDATTLLVGWTQDSQLRSRTISFLSTRFIPQVLSREPLSVEEKRLLFTSAAMVCWAAIALKFGTSTFSSSLAGFSNSIGHGSSPVTMALCVVLILAMMGGLLWALLQILFSPVRLLFSSGLRGEEIARWMFPAALLAALGLIVAPDSVTLMAMMASTLAVLVLLWAQFRAIPGSRLGRGYLLFWGGLLLGSLGSVPKALHALDAFDPSVLPAGLLSILEFASLAGFVALGLAALLEACRSKVSPLGFVIAALVPAGAIVAGMQQDAQLWRVVALSLAPAGAVLLVIDRWFTPMRHYWRPFAAGVAVLALSEAWPNTTHEQIWAWLGLHTAGLVLVTGALLAARAMFAVPMPARKRVQGQRAGGSEIEALRDGGCQLLCSLVGIVAFFMGTHRAAAIQARLNRLPPGEGGFALRFQKGEMVASSETLPPLPELARILKGLLSGLEEEIVSSAGHRFFERALLVASEGLYWLEFESVQQRLLGSRERSRSNAALMEEVSRVPLFRKLNPKQIEELVSVLRRERYAEGDAVFREGETGDRFYIVSAGRLAVLRNDSLGLQRVWARMHPGDCFGELALLGSGVRSASVVAEIPSEVMSLVKADFELFVTDRERLTALIRHGQFLLRVPMFSKLPSSVISMLAETLVADSYDTGSKLVRQGQTVGRLLLVKEGALTVGSQALGPGDAFGQDCFLRGAASPGDVVASTLSTVYWLNPGDLRAAVRGWLEEVGSLAGMEKRQLAAGWNTGA